MCKEHATTFTLYCNNCDRFICHDCLVSLHQYHMTSSISDVKVKLETSILPAIETEVNFVQKNIQEFSTMASKLVIQRNELMEQFKKLDEALNACIREMMKMLTKGRTYEREARQMLFMCYKSEAGPDEGEGPEFFDNNIESHDPVINHLLPPRMIPPCLLNVTMDPSNIKAKDLATLQQFLQKGTKQVQFRVTEQFQCDMFVENIVTNESGQAWIARLGKISLHKSNGEKVNSIRTNTSNTLHFVLTVTDELIYSSIATHEIRKVLKDGHEVTLFNTYPFKPFGLHLTNENELIICLQAHSHGKISTYSLEPSHKGTLLNDIVCQPSGKCIFSKPSKVVQNANGDIIVIESHQRKVVGVTPDGFLKFEYTGSRNSDFEPIGLACDSCGNILVSDYAKRAIILLHANGAYMCAFDLSKHDISRPMGLGIDSEGLLWIGQGNGKVHVASYLKPTRSGSDEDQTEYLYKRSS